MKIQRSYSLDALRDLFREEEMRRSGCTPLRELFREEEMRRSGRTPPPVSSITCSLEGDAVMMIMVTFGDDDEDDDNG